MSLRAGGITRRFTRFGVVGLATNATAYALFLLLIAVGLAPVWASGVVYVTASTASYFANSKWSFQSNASHTHDLPRFLLSYAVGLVVCMGSMAVLTLWLHPAFAQLVVIGISAITIFSCLELLKFGYDKG